MRVSIKGLALTCAALAVAATVSFGRRERGIVEYRKALFSAPLTFDPVMMDDGASLVISELVYEGLLRLSNDYSYEPALATSWTTSSDGKIITFSLRDGATFSDGNPVSAADVVASLSRAVAPGSRVFSYYENIVGATAYNSGRSKLLEGLRAIDSTHVEIHLVRAFPPFMYVLAGATAKVLPRSILATKDGIKTPIGSGPFVWDGSRRSSKGVVIALSRNKRFPHFTGNIDRLTLVTAPDSEAQKLASVGVIDDLSNWPLTGRESIFDKGQNFSSPIAGTWIIGLNSRLSPFESLKVRKDFRASFDSEKFRKVFYPDAEPAFGYIPEGFPGYTQAAKASSVASATVSSKTPVIVAIPEGLAQGQQIAKFIEAEFKAHSWNVEAKIMPWDELMKGYANKSLQAFLVNMNVDYPDSEFLLRNFSSTNPDNFSGIHDAALDRILTDARSTTDRAARELKYREAATMVDEFAPAINLFHPRAHAWISRCVKNFEPNLLSDIYIDYSRVILDASCVGERGHL